MVWDSAIALASLGFCVIVPSGFVDSPSLLQGKRCWLLVAFARRTDCGFAFTPTSGSQLSVGPRYDFDLHLNMFYLHLAVATFTGWLHAWLGTLRNLHLVEIYECQWRRIKKTNSQVQQFRNSKFNRPLDHHKTLTQDQILSAIRNESLFRVVECDVRVPDALKPKFAEMCPIFKNIEISREDISQHMQTFAEEENIMSRPRRSLVGSYFREKILLTSPLIKWYLEHGLEVTHIYQVVEYTPVPCFQPFGEGVSDARRAGDVDPNKAIIADTMKLVSCFPIEVKKEEIRFKVQKNS